MDKESDSYSVSPSQDTGTGCSAGLRCETRTAVAAVTFLVLDVLHLVLRCHYFFLARVFFCRLLIRGETNAYSANDNKYCACGSHATHAYWSPLKDMVVIFQVAEVLYVLYLKENVGEFAA